MNMNIAVHWQSIQCLRSTASLRNANMEGFPQTTGNTQEQKGQIRVSQRTWREKKKSAQLWNKILWADETKINLYQNHRKRRAQRIKGAARDSRHTTSSVKHSGGSVTARACICLPMELGRECLLMMRLPTEIAGCILKSIEHILSAWIQPNAAKLIGRCFKVQMDNDSYFKSNPEASQKQKKGNIHQPNRRGSTQWSLLFTYWRQNQGQKNKQQLTTAIEKSLQNHRKGGNQDFRDVHTFWVSSQILIRVLKIILIFIIMLVCLITFQPLKMGGLCFKNSHDCKKGHFLLNPLK